ncbi:hypothetical protein [Catellatospora coxensis]|uniref:Uncharacterized protein n=1 Tax=Catellatospora coxensis TaxID=310354 RepID=A0A8J3P6K7_9ACTN|nr:hypothetical protein [Catellatospora coxensis]GIG05629.1 hypothetical protein Cco03nite_23290 [Catellatospora coxensis]
MAAVTILAAVVTDDTTAQLVVIAVAVAAFAAVVADTRTSAFTTTIGFVLFEALLADRHGFPMLDGTTTGWHLSVLLAAFGLGLGQRWLRHVRDDAALDREIEDLLHRPGRPASPDE